MKFIKWDYKEQDVRTIKKFALFPITIKVGGRSETRWLETVLIRQRCLKGYTYVDTVYGSFEDSSYFYWENEKFLN